MLRSRHLAKGQSEKIGQPRRTTTTSSSLAEVSTRGCEAVATGSEEMRAVREDQISAAESGRLDRSRAASSRRRTGEVCCDGSAGEGHAGRVSMRQAHPNGPPLGESRQTTSVATTAVVSSPVGRTPVNGLFSARAARPTVSVATSSGEKVVQMRDGDAGRSQGEASSAVSDIDVQVHVVKGRASRFGTSKGQTAGGAVGGVTVSSSEEGRLMGDGRNGGPAVSGTAGVAIAVCEGREPNRIRRREMGQRRRCMGQALPSDCLGSQALAVSQSTARVVREEARM